MVFALIGTIFLFAYVSGLFARVEAAVSTDIPYLKDGLTIYYKTNKGSYHTMGSLFTQTYSIAPKLIQCGLYYDDPDTVPANDCRSAVGVIVTDEHGDIIKDLEKNGYKKKSLPPVGEAIYASFQHVSFLSIFLGISKVLPQLRSYFKKLKCTHFTLIELYDDENIHYIGITKDEDDFLVEDFYPEESDEIVKITKFDIEEVALEGKEKAE
ncbi:hypothetical protein Aperf_G00000058304 [Anoplocephala perfoliata]